MQTTTETLCGATTLALLALLAFLILAHPAWAADLPLGAGDFP
jgi:hypothetical protein